MTDAHQPGPFGEIESTMPLQMRDGIVLIKGWCLAESAHAPAVRLAIPAGTLNTAERHPRPDIARQFPRHPASSGECGFTIRGKLPQGLHEAVFEARTSDGVWKPLKTLTLAIFPQPFLAQIEFPPGGSSITTRDVVFGWAHHPGQEIIALSLRYGHQDIPCDLGKARPDVASTAHAFQSRTILSAAHGTMRIKARLANGTAAIVQTTHAVHIDCDENHDGSIDFSGRPVPLPRGQCMTPKPAAPIKRSLNIAFVLHGSFAANSALHVASLANELSASGHRCHVSVSQDIETIQGLREPRFDISLHREAIAGGLTFPNGCGPDIIHAWTTRECVRQTSEHLRRHHQAKLVVHLEDNEQAITEHALGRDWAELSRLPPQELDQVIPPSLSHPLKSASFLNAADGITLITESLARFIPAGKPHIVFWPAADARFFHPRAKPKAFRALWDRRANETVLFYHGNTHAANALEMRELYRAVRQLNAAGHPVTLLRTGIDTVDHLGPANDACQAHVVNLGLIGNHHHLPELMALADIFVQPGLPDAFNDYRFPSKLPEFFSIGRPVIVPHTNLGNHLQHGRDAYVLERADCANIANAVMILRQDNDLYERLSQGAIAFAATHFSWRRSAEALANFYADLTT